MRSKLTPNFVCAFINEVDIFRPDIFPFKNPDLENPGFVLHYYNGWTLHLTCDEMVELLQLQQKSKVDDLDSYTPEQREASGVLESEIKMLGRCIQMVEELNNG